MCDDVGRVVYAKAHMWGSEGNLVDWFALFTPQVGHSTSLICPWFLWKMLCIGTSPEIQWAIQLVWLVWLKPDLASFSPTPPPQISC